MAEKPPETEPKSPENKAFEARRLESIMFVREAKPNGSAVYKSSDPSRKMVVLQPRAGFEPKEGVAYDVEILHDSDPADPTSGKFTVGVIGEVGGAPIEDKKPVESAESFPLAIEVDANSGKVLIIDTEIPLNAERPENSPPAEDFKYFTLDERTLLTIEKIATAVELKEPCLLEGETSTSKTSSIMYLAMKTGNGVVRLNLNGQTDTSELVGKFIPNDGQLQIQFDDMMNRLELLKVESREILTRAHGEHRSLTLLESQKIAEAEGIKVPDWRWQDGLVPEAMKKGYWLVLDEINLAEPQILERLNPVLEKNPSLVLSENGGATIGATGQEQVHPNFRIFGTMNPAEYSGRAPLSPAYKDRWTSYKFVERPTEKDYEVMMDFMVYGKQPTVEMRGTKYHGENIDPFFETLSKLRGFRELIPKLAKFQTKIEAMARELQIGRGRKEKYIFTRRGLIECLGYMEDKSIADRKAGTKKTIMDDPREIISRALKYYYLDKIANAEDLAKVKDQLDALGIGEKQWTQTVG